MINTNPHPIIVNTMVGQQKPGTPGGFWRRFAASFIDGLIVGIALIPINFIVVFAYKFGTGIPFTDAAKTGSIATAINYGFQIIFVYFYYGYFYSTRGASPGKQLMGLKVLNSETGTYLTFNQAFKREVLGKYILDTLTIGIGYLIAGFREDKKALHDIVFKTQVIKQG